METITGGEVIVGGIGNPRVYTSTIFENCALESYDPTGVSFVRCEFRECKFKYLYLYDNMFDDCTFIKCEFKSPIFTDVIFEKCWFITCVVIDSYGMDHIIFSGCTFMETTFRDRAKSKENDTIEFDDCEFNKSNFINYCLDGTQFEDCLLRKGKLFNCNLDTVPIFNTNFDACILQQTHIENSEWDKVKFKNCAWKELTFGPFNDFSGVVLRQTSVDKCSGDSRSIDNINISPYIINKDVFKSSDKKDIKPTTPPTNQIPKKTHAPYRFISEGL